MAEEGQRLLDRMPQLKAQQELRKDYQKLVDGDMHRGCLHEGHATASWPT